jgi:flagellar FliL protein
MHHLIKIGLLLLAFLLASPSTTLLQASSEGGHGGDAKKGEKKSDKKEAGKAVDGTIEIGPVMVNALSNKGYRYLRLTMQVQCQDNAAAERLVKPDAKEDLILCLSTKVAEDLLPNSGKMILRKELMDIFTKYAGQGKIKNIYFTDFVFQ